MAFNIDPNISLNVKPPQAMSLGDMLNIARGTQEYQQRQKLNPVELETAESEKEKSLLGQRLARETLQPKIEQQEAQTGLAQTQEKAGSLDFQNKQAQIIFDEINSTANDPRIKNATDDAKGAKGALDAILTAKERLLKRGVDKYQAESIVAPYIQMATKNPSGIYQEYVNSQRSGVGAANQAVLNAPQTMTNAQGQIVQVTPGTGNVSVAGQPANMPANTPILNPNPTSAEAALANRTVETNVQNFGDYQKDLTSRVQASTNNLIRTTEARDLMSKFKAGAGSSVYADVAQKLQAIGAPQSLVDKVAGGDLGATQSFNKFLAQSVISGVRQASGGDQARVAEVENFIKNNPTINTDPRALNKLFDFTDKLAKKDFAEQEFLLNKIKTNKLNPQTHFGEAQQFLREQNIVPKVGESKSHGKIVATAKKGNVTYVKYEDGFVAPQ
jgi:hypothetical protein